MSKISSAKYYQENKERLQKKARESLSKEGKKRQYACEQYKNLSEDEKQKLEYRKKYYKKRLIIVIRIYFLESNEFF